MGLEIHDNVAEIGAKGRQKEKSALVAVGFLFALLSEKRNYKG